MGRKSANGTIFSATSNSGISGASGGDSPAQQKKRRNKNQRRDRDTITHGTGLRAKQEPILYKDPTPLQQK